MGCGACVEVCTYGALVLNKAKRVEVNPVLCKGCGLCNTKCPPGAISLKHFTDQEINSEIDVVIHEADILKEIDAAADEV
ncbi:ferredoxin [Sporotomaculum syntrophicum]|uniref:Ferredoxin n=5 Tax=Sporotomaculum syntrophicum TaxID=182264 RepID=A0A9D2WRH0_9FIRM|nr:ferredoxin [Sporotomaculum syntrophicum]